jgi:hypothetical protein
MKKTYTGGCQCGKVRYEAEADIGEVITCNCSRCRKVGSLLSAVAMSDFKLLSGEDEMTEYQFNNRRIHHPFCKTCGIQSYAYGKGPGRQGYGYAQRPLSRRGRCRAVHGEEI